MNQTTDRIDQNMERQCPVCCSPIEPGDETVTCPNCQMAYHRECWEDNNGCATYGCPSAGCLRPPPLKVDFSDFDNPAGGSGYSGTRQCPHCNTTLENDAAFCWACGKEVNSAFQKGSGVFWAWIGLLGLALLCSGIALFLSMDSEDVAKVLYVVISSLSGMLVLSLIIYAVVRSRR